MKYKQYQKMKDSGIEWIGEIPEGWEVIKLKQIAEFSLGLVINPSHYFDENGKIPMITGKNVKLTGLDISNTDLITEESNFQLKDSQIFSDDIVSMRVGYAGRSAVVSSSAHGINCASLIITRGSKNYNSHFICYIFNSPVGRAQTMMSQNGMAQQVVNLGSWKNFIVPLPPKEEQDQISEFLDKQTTQFDELIAKSKEQITLLEEKRQTTINQAVTKGLDPSVPMKDSGVEWIGEIPEHWEVKKLKFVTSCLDGKRIPLNSDERNPGIFPYYGASGIVDYIDDYIFDEKLVCLSEDGENLRSRQLPISFIIEGKTWVNNHAHVLKPINYNHSFLAYFLNSINITPFLEGATRSKLNQASMNNIFLTNPSLPEQQQIEDFLQKQTTQFDELIAKSKAQIKLLQEKRQALITSAVTGKIDVRK